MIKKIYDKVSDIRYHNSHKKAATKALKNIESYRGKTDKKLIALSNEYAKDVLGSKKYAPWLYVYSAFTGTFKEGWIPDNYYGKVIVPKLKGDYGKIGNLNALHGALFDNSSFPDLFYRINGLWLDRNYQVVEDEDVEQKLINGFDKIVFKSDYSERGEGVWVFDSKSANLNEIKNHGNGIIQTYIYQHSFFDQIMSNSVTTLRVTSFIDKKGRVELKACFLRVGRSVDTHVKFNSNIMIPVDINTGHLFKYAITPEWLILNKHPDTNYIFENKIIPNFYKVIESIISLHKKVPFARIIGWDVILNHKGLVKVMEWNGSHNDIKFSEATQGPIFKNLGLEKLWKMDN